MKKRILCFVVSLAMIFTMMPMIANAGNSNVKSGESYRVGLKGDPDATEVTLHGIYDLEQLTVYKGDEEADDLEYCKFQIKSGTYNAKFDADGVAEAINFGTSEVDAYIIVDGIPMNATPIKFTVLEYRIGIKGNPYETAGDLKNVGDKLQLTIYQGNREAENLDEWKFQIVPGRDTDSVKLNRNTGEIVAAGNGVIKVDGYLKTKYAFVNTTRMMIYVGDAYYIDIKSSDIYANNGDNFYLKTGTELTATLMDGRSETPVEDFEGKGYRWKFNNESCMEILSPEAESTVIKPEKAVKGSRLVVYDPENENSVVNEVNVLINYEDGTDGENDITYMLLPSNMTASIYGHYENKATITVPATKEIISYATEQIAEYKITEIGEGAFALGNNHSKLKKITIGTNVTKIGERAFYNAKNLKTIVIKSKKLKTVGKNAFKGINKRATFDVPNSKIKAYKKLFIKAGAPKTIKVK